MDGAWRPAFFLPPFAFTPLTSHMARVSSQMLNAKGWADTRVLGRTVAPSRQ